jgi:hypothetical protein
MRHANRSQHDQDPADRQEGEGRHQELAVPEQGVREQQRAEAVGCHAQDKTSNYLAAILGEIPTAGTTHRVAGSGNRLRMALRATHPNILTDVSFHACQERLGV